ncbi:MAG TPA: GAF domain-containing sensor histidine kinase, partial [Anaerolineales bacterium]|nr:GAF domain-containing sensor histidine kinase [Anaerolineales bacterium]
MRREGIPFVVDWFAISIRWLTLFGLSVSLITQGQFSIYLTIVFLAAGLWNFAFMVLASLNQRLTTSRVFIVVLDLVFANLLFPLSGLLNSSLGWAGLLAVFSAAMYFDSRGLLWVILLSVLTLGGQALLFSPTMEALAYVGVLVLLFLVLGFTFNLLKGKMLRVIERLHQERMVERRKAEQIDEERQRVVYNLVSELSATLNYQRVLDTALDLSATALSTSSVPSNHLVSAALLFADNETGGPLLRVESARRFTPADMRIELPGTAGLLAETIDNGRSHLSTSLPKDPEIRRFVALRACKSACCLPLRNGLDTYGVILFAHPNEDYFTPERQEILDIIGNQAAIAIQNARLYRDLELEKERMMEIQEEARKKLARDLHDGPTQSVAAIAMRINFARTLMERDRDEASKELIKVEELARRTTKEIRHMLFTLRPLVLESQGLIAALESMAEKMRETFGQSVIIDVDPEVLPSLEMNKQAVIFYIAEEAVNNARKHAQADNIWVRLKAVESDITLLEIIDDGVGFDIGSVDAAYDNLGSLGMVNMRERADLVNGVLNIASVEEK